MSSVPKATPIILTVKERAELEGLARSAKSEHRMRQRARIVLLAADGMATRVIARENRPAEAAVRLSNGRFPRGVSGNPGGQPKGLADVRELARQHTATAINCLAHIAEKGKTEMAQIAASTALLDRAWGRPTQPIAGDDDMPPVGQSIEERQRETERRRAEARAAIEAAFGEIRPENSEVGHA
jgi:hypothetical protein